MAAQPNPLEQYSQTELLLRRESSQLRRTNQTLERQIKDRTNDLDIKTKQLKKEINEHTKTEERLQKRIAFDKVLTKISSTFINLDVADIDNNINLTLAEIAKFNGFDRAYIYLLQENGRSLKLTHGWHKKEYPTSFNEFKNLPANLFESWLPRLLNQETLRFQGIADAEKEQGNEMKLLALQNVGSALVLPLISSNETIGFCTLDSQKTICPWQDHNHEPLKMMATIIVNAIIRQKTEKTLAEERNFARQITQTMGQGLVSSTIEGSFEYVNPAYANMLGYEPAELIGKNALTFTVQEDHPQVIQAQLQNMKGKPSLYEARLNQKNGSWRYVLVNSVPNFDAQGQILGTIATITDLTARRQVESQIEENTKEVNLIYNAASKLFTPGSLQELAQQIADIIVNELGFFACDVLLLDTPLYFHPVSNMQIANEGDNFLVCLGRSGHFQKSNRDKLFLSEKGLIPTAVRQRAIVCSPDVTQDDRYVPANTYTMSEMVIPLRAYDHIIGLIDLQSPHIDGFSERDKRIITVFSENAGLALETARLNEKLREHAEQLELQINERVKIEQILRTKEQRYRQFVENATDIIYRTDAHGYCTYANPVTTRVLGFRHENDLLGRHFTEFLHPDFKVEMIKAYNRQKNEAIRNTYHEFIILDKNLQEIWLGQNVQLITQKGQVVGFQALARDITKQRKAEEKLQLRGNELNITNAKLARALRIKDEFLANMSHELRTPLNAILGKAEILQEGIHGPVTEPQIASLKIIEESGNHLLALINDILDVAKIESGKVTLEIQKIQLSCISESSLQFVRQMAHKKQIKLQANIDSHIQTCQADERRLKQILINLLSNAVKFTPVGGEVGLNIMPGPHDNAIQFQVWDTGVGIAPEDMKHLFQPFAQLDSSLARAHEGTGLGLSLVYHLTDMHGGGVSLESEIGVGSCFTVTLPHNPKIDTNRIREEAKADRKRAADLQDSNRYLKQDKAPLILLIEDHASTIEAISEYLMAWDFQVTVIPDNQQAITRIRDLKADLILLDAQISEVNLPTAVQQLRHETENKNTPIIVLSALDLPHNRESCLAAGANEYLHKPVELQEVHLIINQMLNTAENSVKGTKNE